MATNRTIVKTTTPGWYMLADDTDAARVRKQDGDTVLTLDEFEALKNGTPADAEQAATKQAANQAANAQTRKAAAAKAKGEQAEKPVTTLTSGKVVTGETVTIKDAYVAPENRTKAQQKMFESGFEGIPAPETHKKVVAAARGEQKAMPSGEERVIKKQDSFQVRFTVENQKKHRNALRRSKTAAAKAAREAAKA